MIKFINGIENVLSENPLDKGVTVTCFIRQKKASQLLFAIVKDDNIESLTLVMPLSNECASRTITGRKAISLRTHLIEIYKNKKLNKQDSLCLNIQNFRVVSSALFANPELYQVLCMEIAKRIDSMQIWIEDEQLESIPEMPSAHFVYICH